VRVEVDPVLCEAHGVCMGIEPTVFQLGDDDINVVLDAEPDETKRAAIEQAVIRCPRQAISLHD
jgi:ferredoxin